MAAGTSQSKFLETIRSVAEIQQQLAYLVEVVKILARKVEFLERQQAGKAAPDA
jgi:hypothetical protein